MAAIERAGIKDHGTVSGLLLGGLRSTGQAPEVDRDRWDRVLAELLNSDSWLFLLSMDDGRPVGLAAVNFILSLYGSREVARLVMLVVEEADRGRGVGSELMESVLGAARRRFCRELEVRLERVDDDTARFFSKFDFSQESRLLTWRLDE